MTIESTQNMLDSVMPKFDKDDWIPPEEKTQELFAKSIARLGNLYQVADQRVIAKPIDVTNKTKAIVLGLINHIRNDPELLEKVMERLEALDDDEPKAQIKELFKQSYDPETLEEGWFLLEPDDKVVLGETANKNKRWISQYWRDKGYSMYSSSLKVSKISSTVLTLTNLVTNPYLGALAFICMLVL